MVTITENNTTGPEGDTAGAEQQQTRQQTAQPHAAMEQQISDRFEQHKLSRRAELESIDTQISSLGRSIELEQQKIRDGKAALKASYEARTRLMHLRSAMLGFVLELESRELD